MGFKDALKTGIVSTTENKRVKELQDKVTELEREKKEKMYQFGCGYFERNKKADVTIMDEFTKEFILTVNEVTEQIELLNKKKLYIEGMRICKNCGAILSADSVFCNKCGNKLEKLSEEIRGYYCGNCGYELEEQAVFCPNCGKRVVG